MCVRERVRACPSLTVHGHAHGDALLEAAELALVAGDFVDDAAALILAGVGRVEVFLDGPAEEALRQQGGWNRLKKELVQRWVMRLKA